MPAHASQAPDLYALPPAAREAFLVLQAEVSGLRAQTERQDSIPHLSRSSLHRCLQRHDISRLPGVDGDKPVKQKFKAYPLGYFHGDIAEVQTAEGKLYLFVAIDRTSTFAFVELHQKAEKWPPQRFCAT